MVKTKTRRAGRLGLAWVLAAGVASGCSTSSSTLDNQPAAESEQATIRIDRVDNGAAGEARWPEADQGLVPPRLLAFEMAGFSRAVEPIQATEDRAATAQAAAIEALCKALIEVRRSRGQSTADFTVQLGPRVTVVHSTADGQPTVEVDLLSRGVKTAFVVHNGVLQHPPRDLRLLHQLFEETNGEFSLLGIEWLPDARTAVARVGCYVPAWSGEAFAGEAEELEPPSP
mgnify:CR=1 FL=1